MALTKEDIQLLESMFDKKLDPIKQEITGINKSRYDNCDIGLKY